MNWRTQLDLHRLRRPSSREVWESIRSAFTYNPGLKLLSLAAAFAIWFFVNASERDTEIDLQLPIAKLNRPANLIDISPRVDFAAMRVSGPQVLLRRIDRERLELALDLVDVRPGPASFRLQTETLDLPRGVKIVRLSPSEVTLEFARLVRRNVPVRVAYSGRPGGDLRVIEARVAPESVEVSGPENQVEKMKVVETQPIDLSTAQAGLIERNIDLELPVRDFIAFSASAVHAQILLEEPEETRTMKNLPIVVRSGEYQSTLSPSRVQVVVRGPRSAVGALELIQGAVYIDISQLAPGEFDLEPTVDLPARVELVRTDPPSVHVRIKREKRKRDG